MVLHDVGTKPNKPTLGAVGLGFMYAITILFFGGGLINALNRGSGQAFATLLNITFFFGGLMLLFFWGMTQMIDRMALRDPETIAE